MNKAITIELQFFLVSILWGAILLLVYDGFRILRRLVKHNGFVIAVEDLVFWVVSSVFIFAMMYHQNNGIIRGFSVMGMAIGMILYHYILSELVVAIITKFIHTLFRPFVMICNRVKRLARFVYTNVNKLIHFFLRRLKKIIKSVKIALNKKNKKRLLKREIKRKKITEKKRIQAQKKAAEKIQKEEQASKKSKQKATKKSDKKKYTDTQKNERIIKLEKRNKANRK